MFVFDAGQLMKPRWIINFPTKGHWRSRSKLADIASGLDDLRRVIDELGIKSIALPPLGCGNGGLNWSDVRPLIDAKLADLDTEVFLFPPEGTPAASDISVATPRPQLTPGKAALAGMVCRYGQKFRWMDWNRMIRDVRQTRNQMLVVLDACRQRF